MTVEEAREILGEEVETYSDVDIQRDIEVAELFKNMFFKLRRNYEYE